MRNLAQISLLSFILLMSACRKDKTPVLPELKGNLLLLLLDHNNDIQSGTEINIPSLQIDSAHIALDIVHNYADSHASTIVYSKGTLDTIVYFDNNKAIKPTFSHYPALDIKYSKSHHQLSINDFHPLSKDVLEDENLIEKLSEINLLRDYHARNLYCKISILKVLITEFNPELGITIPSKMKLVFVAK